MLGVAVVLQDVSYSGQGLSLFFCDSTDIGLFYGYGVHCLRALFVCFDARGQYPRFCKAKGEHEREGLPLFF